MRRVIVRILLVCAILALAAWGISSLFFGAASPERAFEVKGYQIVDLAFSPDGKKLAVVTFEVGPPDSAKWQVTRIVDVADGALIHAIPHAAWKCAWNNDGSQLAVSAVNGKDFDVWDTAKWKLKWHLTLTPEPADEKKDASKKDLDKKDGAAQEQAAEEFKATSTEGPVSAVPGVVQRLCFNAQGSLFVVTFAEDINSKFDLNHAKVWWDPANRSEPAQSIGSCGGAWDLAAAISGIDALVALTYSNPCHPELLRLGPVMNAVALHGKVDLKELPHELIAPRLQLTPDGNFLAARDDNYFEVITFSSTGPRLVHSIASQTTSVKGAMLFWKELEMSRDGHYAAYNSENTVHVVRIPEATQVLEVRHKPCPFALSPDGSLLALGDSDRRTVVFYRVH
jgi:WD40 repeat protein